VVYLPLPPPLAPAGGSGGEVVYLPLPPPLAPAGGSGEAVVYLPLPFHQALEKAARRGPGAYGLVLPGGGEGAGRRLAPPDPRRGSGGEGRASRIDRVLVGTTRASSRPAAASRWRRSSASRSGPSTRTSECRSSSRPISGASPGASSASSTSSRLSARIA